MYNTSIPLFALPAIMDDASLCKLIRQACDDPKKAEALALMIDQWPVIKRYLGQGWRPYYDEALPFTERDIQRNIRRFARTYHLNLAKVNCQNPDEAAQVRKCFINWVLMILKRDCFDVKRRRNQITIVGLDDPIGQNPIDGDGTMTIGDTIDSNQTWDINQPPKLSDLEELMAEEESLAKQRLAEKINSILESEELTNCYPEKYPQANCAELIRRRLLREPAQKWGNIAQELQTPYGTVTSHWHRRCQPIIANMEQIFEQLSEGENQ